MLPPAYVDHLARGPFPGQIDPWAEDAHYFHQLHGQLIGQLIQETEARLLALGYLVGREASLQILDQREPAEPGEVMEAGIDLEALHIRHIESGHLVTIVEVISPANKEKANLITDYRQRREKLVSEKYVHVVELDFTRSVKRLIFDPVSGRYPYHAALHLVNANPRLVGMHIGQPLATIALPLRGEVLPVALQPLWTACYRSVHTAPNILQDHGYAPDRLPFPSLLTDAQRASALWAVAAWKTELERLRGKPA